MSILSPSLDTVIDISMPIEPGMASWEEKYPPEVQWHTRHLSAERTANSSWRLNSHTGTHVDAPFHHLAAGDRVGELPLGTLIGRCRVADVAASDGRIGPDAIAGLDLRPGDRLLLKTPNSAVTAAADRFTPDFCAVSLPAAERLLADRVTLVGIDAPSIEPYDSTDRAVHRALLGAGVVIVEGLVLHHVDPGDYLLICLPLSLTEAEAAPSRAVLMPL